MISHEVIDSPCPVFAKQRGGSRGIYEFLILDFRFWMGDRRSLDFSPRIWKGGAKEAVEKRPPQRTFYVSDRQDR
jgi:hypothetical protein